MPGGMEGISRDRGTAAARQADSEMVCAQARRGDATRGHAGRAGLGRGKGQYGAGWRTFARAILPTLRTKTISPGMNLASSGFVVPSSQCLISSLGATDSGVAPSSSARSGLAPAASSSIITFTLPRPGWGLGCNLFSACATTSAGGARVSRLFQRWSRPVCCNAPGDGAVRSATAH